MAYADPDDMVARFDERTLLDLCSDNSTPVATLTDDPKLAAALSDGAGEINSAVMVGDLYTAADLAALTGDDLEFLKRLNCELAMASLLGRRPNKWADDTIEKMGQHAREALKMLRDGQALFNIQANKDAGQPSVDGITTVSAENLNLITSRTRNFYPSVGSRLPLGRGG